MPRHVELAFHCPYCAETVNLNSFYGHCYQKHKEVTIPVEISQEYLDDRYGVLGGIDYVKGV